jgi:hypothetical protein
MSRRAITTGVVLVVGNPQGVVKFLVFEEPPANA